MTVATRRKAKTEKPIQEGKPFDCLGFPCRIDYDPNDRSYPMHVDGQYIGFAWQDAEARTTISTFCHELSRHTRATTADMTADADAAANVDEELAGQGLRRASDDEAGWWVRMSNGTKVWATDAPPRSAPTWTNDKIAAGLAPDASDDDRSLALALSNLRARAQNDCPCGSSCPCCDPSHPEAVEQRIEREEAENTDPDLDSAPSPNRDDLAAVLEDAVTAAEPWHRAAWREDWHQRHPATPARAASAQTPPSPPRAVSELQEELERVTDAIHDRKAVGAGYANLHAMREQIIAELDAAHKVESAALRERILKIITSNQCPSCGDPSTGLCPACRESREQPPYAALSDAAMAEPWITQPAPSCANCDGSHHKYRRALERIADMTLKHDMALDNQMQEIARAALGE